MAASEARVAVLVGPRDLAMTGSAAALEAAGFRTVHVVEPRALAAELAGPEPGLVVLDLSRDGVHLVVPAAVDAGWLVVVVADGGREDRVAAAVAAGAHGYVPRSATVEQLLRCVRDAVDGRPLLHEGERARLVAAAERARERAAELDRRMARLSAREREVLGLLAAGLLPNGIARRLHLSITTVRSHVRAILTKLHVHTHAEASALLREHLRHHPGEAGGFRTPPA